MAGPVAFETGVLVWSCCKKARHRAGFDLGNCEVAPCHYRAKILHYISGVLEKADSLKIRFLMDNREDINGGTKEGAYWPMPGLQITPSGYGSSIFWRPVPRSNGIARKFDVDYHALRRHWTNHVSAEARAGYVVGAGATKTSLKSSSQTSLSG